MPTQETPRGPGRGARAPRPSEKPEIEQDPREAREQPEVEAPRAPRPEVRERPGVKEVQEMPDPEESRDQPEIDEDERGPGGRRVRGPSTDVGGPPGIERGVGIETGEESG